MRDRSYILVYGFMLMLGMARPALAQDNGGKYNPGWP
jgi:hypothetical protein